MRGPDQKLDVASSLGDELASVSVERAPVVVVEPTKVLEPGISTTKDRSSSPRAELPHQSEAARNFEEKLKRDLAAGTLSSSSSPEVAKQVQSERSLAQKTAHSRGTALSNKTVVAKGSRLKPLSPSKSLASQQNPFVGLTIFDKIVSLIVYILKALERFILSLLRAGFVAPLRFLKIIPKDDMAAEREKIARARAIRIKKIAAMRQHRAGS